jgi:hypothetical protein
VSHGFVGASPRAETRAAGGKGDLGLSAGRASQEAPSVDPDTTTPVTRADPPAALEWVVHPWRENPGRTALAALAAAILCVLAAWILSGERLVATLLGLAVLGALGPGMAPTRCRLDGAGVARRVFLAWDRRPWPQIRRARLGTRGLFVSPFARAHRLDRFRGLFLPVPGAGSEGTRIREALRREISRHGL